MDQEIRVSWFDLKPASALADMQLCLPALKSTDSIDKLMRLRRRQPTAIIHECLQKPGCRLAFQRIGTGAEVQHLIGETVGAGESSICFRQRFDVAAVIAPDGTKETVAAFQGRD